MGYPVSTTVTLAAAIATGYAAAQVGVAGSLLLLNGSLVAGGVGKPDAPRRVIISSNGNDSAITFAVTGTLRTQQNSQTITEVVAGTNGGVASSVNDFATVASIVPSGNTASTVTAGTNGVGSGPWVPWDVNREAPFQLSINGAVLSGAPTWQVDYTYDDVFGLWLPPGVLYPRAMAIPAFSGQTGSYDGTYTNLVRATRLTLEAVGSVQLEQQQLGML